MVSNDVSTLGPGESCEALLLTPKARVIAPLVVLRRGHEDFLLLTEPELGERVRGELLRSRFAAKAEIETEEHTSHVVFGGEGIETADYGEPAAEVLDAELGPTVSAEELELLDSAGTPPGEGDRRPGARRGR
jgi:folate-binding Fe-S cluster repair protein YgfZ